MTIFSVADLCDENQDIQMTTPVTQERTEEKMIMQFFLPAKYTVDNAPKPKDPNVTITSDRL